MKMTYKYVRSEIRFDWAEKEVRNYDGTDESV